MPKPAALYTWATSTNFAAGPASGTPTKVAPSGGQQAEGFEPAEKPGAQNFNALLGNLFEWAAYVNARWNSSDQLIGPLTVAGALTATGLITASAGLTGGSNQNISVTGTGEFKHARSFVHPICCALASWPASLTVQYTNSDTINHQTETASFVFPLTGLKDGDRITQWNWYGNKTSATGTISAKLYKSSLIDSAETQIGSTQSNNANNPGDISLGQSSLTESVTTGFRYFIRITPGGVTGDRSHGCDVAYDRP